MSTTETSNLRSIALFGHGGVGKTMLAEALLAASGAIPAIGSVERGSTVCDFDPQERAMGHSLNSALARYEWKGAQIQLIDTPGYPDFAGQTIPALAAVDTAMIVINAQTGIELTAERMMRLAEKRGLARMIVINKIDAENIDLPGLVGQIRDRFGKECLLLDLPAHEAHDVVEVFEHDSGDADFDSVAEAHRALIDQIVEEDESLLAQYLEDGVDPSPEALHAPFEKALREGHLIPILFVSAKTGAGIPQLLDVLTNLAPNPAEGNPPLFQRVDPEGKPSEFKAQPDPNLHALAHVFKIAVDPYIGKISIFTVHQGTLKKDMQLFIGEDRRSFKVAHLYHVQGKEYIEVDALVPGEMGAISKVDEIVFDSVLHDSHDEDNIFLKPLEFPAPMQGLSVETKKRGDEQRLFDILGKLALEDPCFVVERHPSTNETVIRGLGDIHLRAKLQRMQDQYKLEVETRPPSIPYRETITRNAETTYRHKKQSGGAGQFGEVALTVEPLPRGGGFEFVDSVKGGAIPGVFMAAVEKGVRQALSDGVVAGFPVEDVRVTVFDGKTHPVDGKEIAFFTAGRKATMSAIRNASPIVLEPIVEIEIVAPDESIGDLSGDLSGKRGHVTGTDTRSRSVTAITGQVPLAELSDYGSRLKSLTAGRGAYTVSFSHYAPVPPQVQQHMTSQYKVQEED
ncbi:MAG: elongation factor G [Betaproteobacteria bacterium]|nr:elongation factor G [Betaproteobacteria bacterium]